jgi:hypothetical protein
MGGSWKFFAGLIAGLLAAFGLNLAAFALVLGVPTETSRWTFEVNQKKQMLASASAPPRLLIVGGSASLFGLSAREIEKQTGQRTLNLATHAALGAGYILDNAKKAARPGDTVLLVFEYELYVSGDRDSVWLDYIVARDPKYFHQLPAMKQWDVLMLTSSQRLLQGLQNRFDPRTSARHVSKSGAYDAGQIDAWGDQSFHPRSGALAHIERRPSRLEFALPDHPANFPAIASFCRWAQEHRVRVLAAYPNMLDQPGMRTPVASENAGRIADFYKQLGVTVVGAYTDVLLPSEQFFDDVYHLTDEAALVRTRRLAEQLKPFLRESDTNAVNPAVAK